MKETAGALYCSFGMVDSIASDRGEGSQDREVDKFLKLPASARDCYGSLPASMAPLLEADEVSDPPPADFRP